MDNIVVGLTGLMCFAAAEMSTNWFESITPLGIVALVIYYFLIKFDKKLEQLNRDTGYIKESIKELAKDESRESN